MIQLSQLEMLHRHGNDWVPLEQVVEHNTPADHDMERRLLRGDKLFKCTECELEILVVPPGDNEEE